MRICYPQLIPGPVASLNRVEIYPIQEYKSNKKNKKIFFFKRYVFHDGITGRLKQRIALAPLG